MTTPIGIVGTGRVATSLAAVLHAKGIPVGAIAGRTPAAVSSMAALAGGALCVSICDLPRFAPRIVVAVNDDALEEIGRTLAASDAPAEVVLHTSGSAGPEVLNLLRARGTATGVLHPLQTFPHTEAGIQALQSCAFAYAGDPAAEAWACELVKGLDGKPLRVDPQRWAFYHAAAVMACNYQVALADAALELMEGAGLDRTLALQALAPLMAQTAANVAANGPDLALTGPIRRGDVGTVLRHIRALRQVEPDIQELYSAAGVRALAVAARAGLADGRVQEIRKALTSAIDPGASAMVPQVPTHSRASEL